ncbi:MAG: hypothetical protein PHQ60_11080 [Sideroxydans sp.]|nr:hypothetical protein [Sideroxydans sp.]
MFNTEVHAHKTIPEPILLARLEQSEQMREFFIQMWLQNPELAKQGGIKVRNLLTRLADANTGAETNADSETK